MFYRLYLHRVVPIIFQFIVLCALLLCRASISSADEDPGAASLTNYSISGRVTYQFSNDPFPGVVIVTSTGITATTNNMGRYQLQELPTGTYVITPTTTINGDALIAFPAAQEVTLPPAIEDLNFGVEIVVADGGIAGQIVLADGSPVDGVTLYLSTGSTAVTDAQGRYRFFPLAPGDYTFWPSKAGYTFEPDVRTVHVPAENGAQDFVAGIMYLINLPIILY